ncbi:MAG: UDP-N-acetylmuramoyl-L-alanyl-D-glutamate--2,6-diaminopimelate ligase [Chitinophagaceae bacterium]|nr:UDP-N-acetylmuramoyl-L-alanyl-D-glutamate--2,6-diaminopimelate ligase [Chitinophagaceae bacterium]
MKTLNDILSAISVKNIHGETTCKISGICIDSRQAQLGSLFVAIKGTTADGHQYIDDVVSKGAACIVCEKLPAVLNSSCTYVLTDNPAEAAGLLASAFYGHPSSQMKVVGITGTNGKTTCATLMHQLFKGLGYTSGLLSTVNNCIGDKIIPSTHTTPDPVQLQHLLRQMKDAGCTHVFMEVSSHAIHQHRIAGIQFDGACFTNITHDHLDYHETFDEYIRVKKQFFDDLPKQAFALVNADDKRGLVMLQNTAARKRTYSLRTLADYKGKILENNLTGLILQLNNREVFFRMIGEFNAYNILCVWGAAMELGEDAQDVLTVLSTLKGAEGRFDYIVSNQEQILGIIDYAHTPDALLNVLTTINKFRKGNESLFTVIGCGGDRDKSKRPLMGLVACEHSDKVIFTSDNPRSEDPAVILQEMEAGVPVHQKKKYVSIADRREAIKTACSIAEQGDIVLVAGKGHEKYQEVKGVKNPFDDKQIVQEMFNLLEK